MGIYSFSPVLVCCALKIVLPVLHYIEQKYISQIETILRACAANHRKPGKSSEINKQFHVKSWLT